jgi:K+-transporting ATPase KdpF subunit
MSVIDVISLLLAVVLAIYLIVALLEPEKFQ